MDSDRSNVPDFAPDSRIQPGYYVRDGVIREIKLPTETRFLSLGFYSLVTPQLQILDSLTKV